MRISLATVAFIAFTTLASCKKDKHTVDAGPTALLLLVDKNDGIIADRSGTTVTVENTLQTLPVAADGTFGIGQFQSSGPLTLILTRPNFNTVRKTLSTSYLDSLQKGKAELSIPMFETNPVVVNSVSGKLNGTTFEVTCNVTVPNESANTGVSLFIQRNASNISPDNFFAPSGNPDKDYQHVITTHVLNGENVFSICLTCSQQCGAVKSGDVLYVKAYANLVSRFETSFVDSQTGKWIFPNVSTENNSSGTISLVIP
jgi:hypothetical protein